MPENEPPSADKHELDELLVAYLDGELDAAGVKQVESRLADSEEARRRLLSLGRAWDALDVLSRAEVRESFSADTVEMLTVEAQTDLATSEQRESKGRWRRGLVAAASLLAAAAAGFVLIDTLRPDPNEVLIRDLPVVEELDEYLHAGDIDYLRALAREGLFKDETDDAL